MQSSGPLAQVSPFQQKLSKPMENGSLLGTHLLKPPHLYSSTEELSSNSMGGTSSIILHPCQSNYTPMSSTMTELSRFMLPKEETWSSQTLQTSKTFKSSGSITQLPLLLPLSNPSMSNSSKEQVESFMRLVF